jgi:stage V sporulation protein R
MTGRQKLFEVRRSEDDVSFLRNYLTDELMVKLNLFSYGSNCTHPPGQRCANCQDIVITSRERDAVIEALITPRYNYGVPRIVVTDVVNNKLCLEDLNRQTAYLDRHFADQTLAYIAEIWQHPVDLLTSDEQGHDVHLTVQPR